MKKFIIILILASFSLVGCSNDDVSLIKSSEIAEYVHEAFVPENVMLGDFTILEGFHGFPGDRSSALTIEEAALIGAIYILDVFDENLDDKYMELTFNYNPHLSHSTWVGNIADAPEEFEGDEEGFQAALITFSIDAITGERININNHNVEPLHGITFSNLMAMSEAELLELFPRPSEEEVELSIAIARHYAQRHFNHGEIVNIEQGFYYNNIIDFIYFPSAVLNFVAINDQGRVVEIEIQRESMELVSIVIPFEFLFPDFY